MSQCAHYNIYYDTYGVCVCVFMNAVVETDKNVLFMKVSLLSGAVCSCKGFIHEYIYYIYIYNICKWLSCF